MSRHGVDTLHQRPSSVLSAGIAGVSLAERAMGEDSHFNRTGDPTWDHKYSTQDNKAPGVGQGSALHFSLPTGLQLRTDSESLRWGNVPLSPREHVWHLFTVAPTGLRDKERHLSSWDTGSGRSREANHHAVGKKTKKVSHRKQVRILFNLLSTPKPFSTAAVPSRLPAGKVGGLHSPPLWLPLLLSFSF